MLVVVLVGRLPEPSCVVWRAVLEMCWREVRSRVRECAGRHIVLMIAVPALAAHASMILMLVIHVMGLMTMILILKRLVHAHLVSLVSCTAIEQAMILSMAAVIVHAVGVVRRRVRARRPVGRGSVGVRLKQASAAVDGRAIAVVWISRMRRVVVVVELTAGIEPVVTIGHHQTHASFRERRGCRTCRLCPPVVKE